MKAGKAVLLFALGSLLSATAAWSAMEVLVPRDGYASRRGEVWVVVKWAKQTPTVTLDGREVGGVESYKGVYHARVAGISEKGSQIEVRSAGSFEKRKVYRLPGGGGEVRFHEGGKIPGCGDCHSRNEKSCARCHSFGGSDHAANLADRCLSCHGKKTLEGAPLAAACGDCHGRYDTKRHPKLKHALSGGQDPNRPGKGLDCASCHDPHTPVKLSRLGPMELRKWCQDCHSTP
jgi:hypothetical protein